MPIPQNDREERKIAIQELAAKLKIEVPFERDIKSLFREIIENYKVEIGLTKQANFESIYGTKLTNILDKHYAKAQKEAITFFLKDPIVRSILTDQELLIIRNATKRASDQYIKQRSAQMSKEILTTTQNNLAESYVFVERFARDNNLNLTTDETNSMAMDNFQTRLRNRSTTIAITETQNVYESTKQEEAAGVNERLIRQGKNMQKRWIATLDSRTRVAHAQAHGQRVPLKSLYTIGSDLMEYPGDTSHGASLGNVINCRCSSMFVLFQE